MVNNYLIFIFCWAVTPNLLAQETDSLPNHTIGLNHLYIRIDDTLYGYTEDCGYFGNRLLKGFEDYSEEKEYLFKEQEKIKSYDFYLSGIDTIQTIKWNGNDTLNPNFNKRIFYSYLLYKFGENILFIDTIPKLRLLIPDDPVIGSGEWHLIKLELHSNFADLTKKTLTNLSYSGWKVINSSCENVNNKTKESIMKEIVILSWYDSKDCFDKKDFFPAFLEYYDGQNYENYFLMKCENKELWRQNGRVVYKLLKLQ